MSSKLDLGPPLALAGAATAIISIIAGFVVVGGPGNARDLRLDEQTSQRMLQIALVVQCAYGLSNAAPATYEAATQLRIAALTAEQIGSLECPILGYPRDFTVLQGRNPPNFGDVSYDVIAPGRVAICGNFRTAYQSDAECTGLCLRPPGHMDLGNSRSVGINCYEEQLG